MDHTSRVHWPGGFGCLPGSHKSHAAVPEGWRRCRDGDVGLGMVARVPAAAGGERCTLLKPAGAGASGASAVAGAAFVAGARSIHLLVPMPVPVLARISHI